MKLKNKNKDLGFIKTKLFIIQSAAIIFEEKYEKYLDEEDKDLLKKIKRATKKIHEELYE